MTAARDRAALLAALGAQRDLADWSVRVVTTQRAWRQLGDEPAGGALTRTTLGGALHRDGAAGRGSATFSVAAGADARGVVAQAAARADAAIAAPWTSPPPAAPALVDTADPALDPAAPGAALDAIAAALTAAAGPGVAVAGDLTVTIDEVELFTRRGQQARWRETAVAVDVTVGGAAVAARARRVADLALADAVARARAPAGPPLPAGTYPVTLTAAALLHGDRGLLEAFVSQADPRLERQGLVRYRPGQPVAPGATLSLASDGTLPFGWYSAPLGRDAEAVRRFPLVERGVASGLGLDVREAALRGQLPNGGVRGLVVPPGPIDDEVLRAPGTLVIDALTWLEVEPTTGWFRAGFAGGTLRGDAIELLGRARTSLSVIATPTYRGPALWHLGAVAVD